MRVIAGRLRGRTLVAPRGQATRPTSDRVREALFSILGPLAGARVLDLYAGTGALGIEALSRGAAHATFVEHDPAALAALSANLRALALHPPVAAVLPQRVERALRTAPLTAPPFDLTFVDPPYADVHDGTILRVLDPWLLAKGGPLPTSRLVLEHASADLPPELERLSMDDQRAYGDTALAFYAPR